MIFSEKIERAVNFAIKVHQLDREQKRKGKTIPYIIHPLTLGIILARAKASEDVIVAGILHDTIEDSSDEFKITKEIIQKEFGEKIAQIVNDLTEQDKSLPWKARKQKALEHIEEMDEDSLLVKSADVLHNLRDQILDYEKLGDEMFTSFNAPKTDQLERYVKLITAIKEKWPNNPLLPELEQALSKVKKLWR